MKIGSKIVNKKLIMALFMSVCAPTLFAGPEKLPSNKTSTVEEQKKKVDHLCGDIILLVEKYNKQCGTPISRKNETQVFKEEEETVGFFATVANFFSLHPFGNENFEYRW